MTVFDLQSAEVALREAFHEGDFGNAALQAWLIFRVEPAHRDATFYARKILRTSDYQSLTVAQIRAVADKWFEEESYEDAICLAAVGLLKYPQDDNLKLLMAQASSWAGRLDLINIALEEADLSQFDDMNTLNVMASVAHDSGDYQTAVKMFSELSRRYPASIDLRVNLSASLFGAARFEEAIALLEQLLSEAEEPLEAVRRLAPMYKRVGKDSRDELDRLDRTILNQWTKPGVARASSAVRMFLQDFSGAAEAMQRALDLEKGVDFGARFELGEMQLALGNYEQGFANYKARFKAFPELQWITPTLPEYDGRQLTDDAVFVWAEQGIGDEVFFAHALDELSRRVQRVVMALDKRLIPYFQAKYPQWRFVDRGMARQPDDCAFAISLGELFRLFCPEILVEANAIEHPLYVPSQSRLDEQQARLSSIKRPKIAISWRGGRKVNGRIRSLTLAQFMSAVPAEFDAQFLSMQYDQRPIDDISELGDPRVVLSGIDNRKDLDGVFAVLASCDAIVTIDNSVAHFACALGLPVHVLIPAAQSQFRWKNETIRRAVFPTAKLFPQERPGSWDEPLKTAWQSVIKQLG